MLIVEAYYRCMPGLRDRLMELLKPNVEGTRKEPGNFEKWENVELFNHHSKTEHHQTFCSARRPLLEPGSYHITIYNAEENVERTNKSRDFVKQSIN